MANWETLWDAKAIDGAHAADNGDFFFLWQLSENVLAVGDTVRITVDGTVYNLTVRAGISDSFAEAGNKWIESSNATDNGEDIYFWEYGGWLRFFTRKYFGSEMPHVKFERAASVPTLDPTALLMGWQVGNRIASMKK